MARLQQRFRAVVAMWIFVGLFGGPACTLIGIGLLTSFGPFQPTSAVPRVVEFAPGAEIDLRGKDGADLGPGDFMVLARPASVDPETLICEGKSRVYTTGEQRTTALEPARAEGVAPVVTASDTEVEYRTVLSTASGGMAAWMGIDHLTCDGAGVTAFAVAEDDSMSDGLRMVGGSVAVVMGLVVTGLGYGALTLTRRWSRPPDPHTGPVLHPSMHSYPSGHGHGVHPGPGQYPHPSPGYGPHPGHGHHPHPGPPPQPHPAPPPGDPDNPFRAPPDPDR